MADIADERAGTGDRELCLDLSLQAITSHLSASDGRQIPFTRAILTLRNVCDAEVVNIVINATLGPEGGTSQDVTSLLSHSTHSSIPPGGTISLDVYDLLLPAHSGTASKIHMFGYRAALNWKFELAAYAQYRPSISSEPLQTPVLRWSFRWSITDPATGAIGLAIEKIREMDESFAEHPPE